MSKNLTHYTIAATRHLTLIAPRLLSFVFYKLNCIRKFKYDGIDYNYSLDTYNWTWTNERTIEIPIFKKLIKDNKDKDILEIGNVMSHYINSEHDIVDKYEEAEGVLNYDIADCELGKKYDLIIAISTLEHVGWHDYNENEFEPEKLLKAFDNIFKHLKPNGKLIYSFPLGYNPELDKYIEEKKIKVSKQNHLVRGLLLNSWETHSPNDKKHYPYNRFWRFARELCIIEAIND